MFQFEHSEYFILLLIVPLFAGLAVFSYFRRKRDIRMFGDPGMVMHLIPEYSQFRKNLKSLLLILALLLLIIGIAGPRFGSRLTEVKHEGIEIMVALDVSNSMRAEDIPPNRLERAKQELSKLMDKLSDDRIGLIVFAGDAYSQIPITSDYLSAKMFLNEINTGMVSRQGTDIAEAIDLALKSFSPDTKAGKALIIISDGENHEGNVEASVKKAKDKGIRIFTIGMGLPQGARIPERSGSGTQDFLRDKDGNFIVTRLDEKLLAGLAETGKGRYYRATAQDMGLRQTLAELRKIDKAEMEFREYTEFEEQFPVFIWISLALFAIEFMLLDRKNKWLRKIRLFS
jgi:Ca-activated chloride channel family protein